MARLLGLSDPGRAEWAHLRVLQLGKMARSAQVRTVILLLPAIAIAGLAAGRYPPVQVAGWATLWCALGWLAVEAHQALAQARPGALRLRHLWGHALVIGGSALAWAMLLVLTAPHASLVDHFGLVVVAALMVGALAFATRPPTRLATLVFAIALGAATITGLAVRGAWSYAGVALAIFCMAGWAALEVARGHLASRVAEAELVDRDKLVSLLLREFEEHEADWLWQIDTAGGVRRVSVAINVAGQQLLEPGFAATVARALGDGGLPPAPAGDRADRRTLLRYPASALRTLEELARLGCALALDDFGTGTSSLGQLRQLNLSHIKIDRSFVRGAACGHAEGMAIVRAVVAMAQSIGMTTTAEGVESAEEAVR